MHNFFTYALEWERVFRWFFKIGNWWQASPFKQTKQKEKMQKNTKLPVAVKFHHRDTKYYRADEGLTRTQRAAKRSEKRRRNRELRRLPIQDDPETIESRIYLMP